MVLPRVRAYSSGSRTCQYNAAANTVSTAVPMIQKPVRIAFLIVFTPFSQRLQGCARTAALPLLLTVRRNAKMM